MSENENDKSTNDSDATSELGDGGKRALDALRAEIKALKKDLSTEQGKVKAFEDRDKSDAEKASDALRAAEDARDKAQLEALRLQVAFDKGLTPKQARRLVGANEDELKADADDLLESFPNRKDEDKSSGSDRHRPTENLRPGTSTEVDNESDDDVEAIAAEIRGANNI